MLEIEEVSDFAKKKYVVNPENHIYIGSKEGMNDILIVSPDVDAIQCEILMYQNDVYIRNVGEFGNPILKRKTEQAPIRKKTIKLYSKDIVMLGNEILTIRFIHV